MCAQGIEKLLEAVKNGDVSISDALKKIKALPPLDDTILKIQRICVDKNSSLADLVKVVESDPMLTANILKSSNSKNTGKVKNQLIFSLCNKVSCPTSFKNS